MPISTQQGCDVRGRGRRCRSAAASGDNRTGGITSCDRRRVRRRARINDAPDPRLLLAL